MTFEDVDMTTADSSSSSRSPSTSPSSHPRDPDPTSAASAPPPHPHPSSSTAPTIPTPDESKPTTKPAPRDALPLAKGSPPSEVTIDSNFSTFTRDDMDRIRRSRARLLDHQFRMADYPDPLLPRDIGDGARKGGTVNSEREKRLRDLIARTRGKAAAAAAGSG